MRDTHWTPSIVPGDEDRDVCLVVNDFGRRGSAYCETDVEATDLETMIQDLLDGQYWKPVRVVSFNTGEGWSRDISADVAGELRRRCDLQMRDIPSNILDSSLRDVKQDDSNNEVAASGGGEQIDDILDGLVGAVVGDFELAVWAILRIRTAVEAAVGKWSAQPLVEEQK